MPRVHYSSEDWLSSWTDLSELHVSRRRACPLQLFVKVGHSHHEDKPTNFQNIWMCWSHRNHICMWFLWLIITINYYRLHMVLNISKFARGNSHFNQSDSRHFQWDVCTGNLPHVVKSMENPNWLSVTFSIIYWCLDSHSSCIKLRNGSYYRSLFPSSCLLLRWHDSLPSWVQASIFFLSV